MSRLLNEQEVFNRFVTIHGLYYYYSKFKYIKQGFDPLKTEREIMKERGFNRIYDCGTLKFEWNKDS